MRFRAEHSFSVASLQAFETLFFDEPFNEALCKDVHIERKLLLRDVADNRLTRDVLMYPERQVPGPIAKLTGGQKIGYTEHVEYAFGSFAGTFVCTPTVLQDRVHTTGSFHFELRGTQVVRVVQGEVTVKVFGVGGIIERFVVADVEKSYADAAAFTERYLAQHPNDPHG